VAAHPGLVAGCRQHWWGCRPASAAAALDLVV
jgi:hypothetical protein